MVEDSLARTVTRLVADGPADADLLRLFVATRDEAAFALIVRRHGPMIFGVCRRTLGHQQDAEDAFQAVFLVLARKTHAVRPNGLSRWLYGVAVRVANKARVRWERRTAGELPDVAAPPAAPPADWLPLLDAALARLPDRDRGPILLCDLLGPSRADAAAELGIAEGTLSSRLARARGKLRARLARLGASLSLTTLAAGLADQAGGTVPFVLVSSTVSTSGTSAAKSMAEGAIRSMFLIKTLKLSTIGLATLGILTAGIGWLPSVGGQPAPPPGPKGLPLAWAAPTPKDPTKVDDKRLRELQVARIKALETQLEGEFERVKIGKDPLIVYLDAVRELTEAKLEIAETKEARVAVVEEMVKELKQGEEFLIQLQQAGLNTKQGVAQATAARLKTEIQLEKIKLGR
jgi:RNA polymerase sigma factor (sigma-70 family)